MVMLLHAGFDRWSLARLQQGAFVSKLLGKKNPDLLRAQEFAARTQALLIVKDGLLQEAGLADVRQRNNALLQSTLNNPFLLKKELDEAFPEKITEDVVFEAQKIVDSGKEISESHPAVPAYDILFGKVIDRNFSDGVLRESVGLRLLNLLEDPRLHYPKVNTNPKLDSPALLNASNQLNALREVCGTAAFPKTQEQKRPFYEAARTVLEEGVGLIRMRYPSVADDLEQAHSTILPPTPHSTRPRIPVRPAKNSLDEGPGH
ncbi:MAG: hypothetical protein PHS57_02290 [Alphaproteobacteria bacterium]|nr:hypothetical protein [Alphaproteobacteria bacterium]